MKKGFTLGQLPQVFLVILFIGIIVGASYMVLTAFNASLCMTTQSKASEGIGYIIEFLDNIVSNLPTVGIIVFIVVLLGVLMYIRMGKRSSGA